MNRILHSALVLSIVIIPALAHGSSHREAPAIAYDPAADNTDVYAWVTASTRDKVYLIANYIPLQEPAGGPNFHGFSDDVRYEINVARGGTSMQQRVSYRVEFSTDTTPFDIDGLPFSAGTDLIGGHQFFSQLSGRTQTATVTKVLWNANGSVASETVIASDVGVAPPNIGPRTDANVYQPGVQGATYDDAFAATFITDMGTSGDEGRVFLGPRDDGFYVDLGGVFDLAGLRAPGTDVTQDATGAVDGVAGYNVHTIALEIPTGMLSSDGNIPSAGVSADETLGIWATASRRKVSIIRNNGTRRSYGRWVQVSRLGFPLINEAVIGIQDKDRFNSSHPADDLTNWGAYILNPVIVEDADAVGIYTALGADPTDLKSGRGDIADTVNLNFGGRTIDTVSTVLRLDLGVDSGFPNGRPIPGANANQEQADVTDVILSLVLTGATSGISDGASSNDKDFLSTFPFLPLPHQGYNEGHGAPAPAP